MTPLKIIFAGSGEFGLPTLNALADAGHHLVQIISQPDRPAGRGRKLTPTPIAQFALDHHLPLLRPTRISSLLQPSAEGSTTTAPPETPPSRAAGVSPASSLPTSPPPHLPISSPTLPPADLMVVIAFGQKIPEAIVHHPRLGSINLHASLLPKYRGAAPINYAMLSGDTTTGNSVIRLAQKMDAGAILAQSHLPIAPTETAGELHDRLAADGPPLVLRVLEQLATNTATETPQDESLATLAPKLSRETATLDFSRPAAELARKINALSPWPGCRVRILDADGHEKSRATLTRAACVSNETFSRWQPGEISLYGPITAGDGQAVDILQIQPEGKRPMPLSDFRNGHPWHPGMRLESLT